eukprot:6176944-Prymnesium_polylepis.1
MGGAHSDSLASCMTHAQQRQSLPLRAGQHTQPCRSHMCRRMCRHAHHALPRSGSRLLARHPATT